MTSNLLLSLNVVFPIFFMMSVGYLIRKLNMVDDHSLTIMNNLVFRVFMAILLFVNVSKMDIGALVDIQNLTLILLLYGVITSMVLFYFLIYRKTVSDINKVPVMIQGSYRANLILFGIPMATALYGENGAGIISIAIAGAIPLFNVLAILILEGYANKNASKKKLVMSILKNPLIISCFLGIMFVVLGIKIPNLLLKPLVSMGGVATPLAFIILGATLKFSSLIKNLKFIFVASFMKLIILPLVAITLGIKFGFVNEHLLAILGATGSPIAIASFIMVKEIGGDENLAAELIVSSSVLSIFTLFVWIFSLKTLGFL
ncbi:AEC family transporter [Fusobacterium sp. IOR10]|uniref:AEC family transporter n=1 Tax=Fusobacterium sp. IOR10 TaxID=2665157 RepID=UPI0013D77606|nr:AEC family transporter [Fusobacterium sp. IOR10]